LSSDYVGCSELRKLRHSDIGDDFILNLIGTHLSTSTYQAFNSANIRLLGWTNDIQVEKQAFRLLSLGRITAAQRKYFIDVLCGDDIFYTTPDGTEAVLYI
jgi:hypothetical protein